MKQLVLFFLTILSLSITMVSCNSDSNDDNTIITYTKPVILSTSIGELTYTSAKVSASMSSDLKAITERGICWSTSPNPTVQSSANSSGDIGQISETTNSFTTEITGLSPQTRYYFRAFATNEIGTTYGEEISFTTKTIANLIWHIKVNREDTEVWNADIQLNPDHSGAYDEPDFAGKYFYKGDWTFDGVDFLYRLNADEPDTYVKYKGTLDGTTMSGLVLKGDGSPYGNLTWTGEIVQSEILPLQNTNWNVNFLVGFTIGNKAVINFHDDGTFFYTEPDKGTEKDVTGQWSVDENNKLSIIYEDASDSSKNIKMYGYLLRENNMTGQYIISDETKVWTATKF